MRISDWSSDVCSSDLDDEVLGGTGLVEAGTYIAVLAGTIAAGWINAGTTAALILCVALLGYYCGRQVPPAPPMGDPIEIDHNVLRSSWRLIGITMQDRKSTRLNSSH